MITTMRVALEQAGLLPETPPPKPHDSAACWKKIRHPTVESALAQAHQLAVHMYQRHVGVYSCSACHGYHVTHEVNGHDTVACSTWSIP